MIGLMILLRLLKSAIRTITQLLNQIIMVLTQLLDLSIRILAQLLDLGGRLCHVILKCLKLTFVLINLMLKKSDGVLVSLVNRITEVLADVSARLDAVWFLQRVRAGIRNLTSGGLLV